MLALYTRYMSQDRPLLFVPPTLEDDLAKIGEMLDYHGLSAAERASYLDEIRQEVLRTGKASMCFTAGGPSPTRRA